MDTDRFDLAFWLTPADFQGIGIRLPDDELYNPESDVTVIDAAIEIDQVYAERFYFVAEVLSNSNRPELRAGSDKPMVLAAKIDFYKLHEHCRGVLIVRQDRVEAQLFLRADAWAETKLGNAIDHLTIPDIGDIGPLGCLYRHTPLWQSGFDAL